MTCCSKVICNGCEYAQSMLLKGKKQTPTCPFCRHPSPQTRKDKTAADKNRMKRIGVNDPAALREEGMVRYYAGDYKSAFEYWTKSVEFGDVGVHHEIALLYRDGQGVEKDEKKEEFHLEQAAIGGHPIARHNLGNKEARRGRFDRAVKHWIVAANLGEDLALNALKQVYPAGFVSKDDLAAALRGHQAAINATKSPQREAAFKLHKSQLSDRTSC
jgi:hypothetical protein